MKRQKAICLYSHNYHPFYLKVKAIPVITKKEVRWRISVNTLVCVLLLSVNMGPESPSKVVIYLKFKSNNSGVGKGVARGAQAPPITKEEVGPECVCPPQKNLPRPYSMIHINPKPYIRKVPKVPNQNQSGLKHYFSIEIP